ncbi:coiled-coil domain-containing protein 62 isoform X2 [Denticeps clupeoides]|uniref:Coiled-coil domain containing 62 n=1 Tax=Denticeps clupeoides TaxID=299321 RepID=A0AAY4CM92_9TELE|nr:coiled-coil domain-containing protein 62 isoform X2 [Denticeps clupeoides]
MDGDGGDDRSSRLDSTSNFSQLTNVIEPSPWHSTPLKKSVALVPVRGREGAADQTDERLYHPQLSATLPTLQESELDILETSAIQKQRREMQALIAQVKEAEQELTTTLAAQQKRQKSWEQDHQRVLALEQKCARLKDELSERNEIIKEVTKRMKELDLQERDGRRALRISQNKLHELKLKQQLAARQQQDLEVGTRSLNSTIMALSSQIGQLQVREEELSSMLKLKDNDVIEATNHILDLSGRIGELESSILESQTQQNKLLKELKEYKHDSKQTRREIAGLKEELQEKTTENSIQREELIRLKQENQLLRRELVLTGEGENWKDELLSLARSKQQRLEAELHSMQKVCEIRENDLTLLRMKLDNHQETPRQSECQRSHCSQEHLHLDSRFPSQGISKSPGLSKSGCVSRTNLNGDDLSLWADSCQTVFFLGNSRPTNRTSQSPTHSHSSQFSLSCSPIYNNGQNHGSPSHTQASISSQGSGQPRQNNPSLYERKKESL